MIKRPSEQHASRFISEPCEVIKFPDSLWSSILATVTEGGDRTRSETWSMWVQFSCHSKHDCMSSFQNPNNTKRVNVCQLHKSFTEYLYRHGFMTRDSTPIWPTALWCCKNFALASAQLSRWAHRELRARAVSRICLGRRGTALSRQKWDPTRFPLSGDLGLFLKKRKIRNNWIFKRKIRDQLSIPFF